MRAPPASREAGAVPGPRGTGQQRSVAFPPSLHSSLLAHVEVWLNRHHGFASSWETLTLPRRF